MEGITAFSLSEVEEGSEPDEFWKVIGGKKYYCSLAHGKLWVYLFFRTGVCLQNFKLEEACTVY